VGVYVARLICSDEDCAAEVLAEARTLAELETLACACGCGLAIIGWPDHVGGPIADVVVIGPGSRSPPADLAA
jgi:hypothetical protein